VLVLAQAADDVAVHDLYVINVEQEFHVWGIDALDEFDTKIHVVTEIAGVPLHRVRVIAAVQMFQAEIDLLLLGVPDDSFPALDAIPRARFIADTSLPHTGESDDFV